MKCNKDGCHSSQKISRKADKDKLLSGLRGWEILPEENCIDKSSLNKHFEFENFADALEFVNKIGILAEKMNHHPDIRLEWGKVGVEIWTHAVGGLTKLDFALAQEIDYEINQK